MKRAPPLPPRPLIIQPSSNPHQLMSRRHRNECPQLPPPPIVLLNLMQVRLHNLHAGNRPRTHHLRQFRRGYNERIELWERGLARGRKGRFPRGMELFQVGGWELGFEGGRLQRFLEVLQHGGDVGRRRMSADVSVTSRGFASRPEPSETIVRVGKTWGRRIVVVELNNGSDMRNFRAQSVSKGRARKK